MNKTMNIIIILINILVVFCAVVWVLFLMLPGDDGVSSISSIRGNLIISSLPVLALLSIIFSHIDHSKRAILWAIAPLLCLIIFILSVIYIGETS